MKKIISITIVLILATMLFVGCTQQIDVANLTTQLKAKGLTEGMCYVTEEECERATSLTNSEIRFMGDDFTVEIVNQISLIENDDYSKACTFITFATEEQARKFTELEISYFKKIGNTNNWKFAYSGCVVVLTNLEVAFELINLRFR